MAPASASLQVLQRGWLSSNNILICGEAGTALIDSGYCTHAAQTLALVAAGLQGRPLDLLLNTHLHSDHCGGNAALQAAYPGLHTLIPPGQAQAVRDWDATALSHVPTGQSCPRFAFDGLLQPGSERMLGGSPWQVHAAPGHDPHSVILFQPATRVLISADALWQQGFGVVFPEIEGIDAFAEVAATLDLIESLQPLQVIPGHGAPFHQLAPALATARQRLAAFVASPARHRRHAAKVLLKFKLLEWQRVRRADLLQWARASAYLCTLLPAGAGQVELEPALEDLVQDLVRSGAAALDQDWLLDR